MNTFSSTSSALNDAANSKAIFSFVIGIAHMYIYERTQILTVTKAREHFKMTANND